MVAKRRTSRLLALFVTLAILASAWLLRFQAYDAIRLYNYSPPGMIAQLATDNALTPSARRLFYVQHPAIQDKTTFRKNCPIFEQTIVLGCYVGRKGIYLLEVDDARLSGVEQVTAAHEFLHAAYDRLSGSERQRVNKLLEQAYALQTDQRIKSTVEAYRSKDQSIVTNELHSILGTEAGTLTPELETYYKQYFSDRQKIVDYSNTYEAAFTDRKNKLQEYNNQLTALKKQVDEKTTNYNALNAGLKTERSQLESLYNAKQYEAYNAAVDSYNQKVATVRSLGSEINGLIDKYNDIYAQAKDLQLESEKLFEAIDTRVTAPAQ